MQKRWKEKVSKLRKQTLDYLEITWKNLNKYYAKYLSLDQKNSPKAQKIASYLKKSYQSFFQASQSTYFKKMTQHLVEEFKSECSHYEEMMSFCSKLDDVLSS